MPTLNKYSFLICITLLSIASLVEDTHAQGGRNNDAVFAADFVTDANDTKTVSVIDGLPVIENSQFKITLVLQGAVDLMGLNCDLVFDPNVLQVVSIGEAMGDLNFDGRANIADILTLAERFGVSTAENGFAYFDRDTADTSNGVIDSKDIEAAAQYINQQTVFWTSNDNHNLSLIRESVEIFEKPEVSNAKGRIDDIVVALLSRIHPVPEGFGFDGDARIADIVFRVVGDLSSGTQILIEDTMAIDEGTEITPAQILNSSQPSGLPINIQQ